MLTLVADAHPEEFLAGGKHLTSSALDELVASLVHWSFSICGGDSAHHHDIANLARSNTNLAAASTSHQSDDQRSINSNSELNVTANEADTTSSPQLSTSDTKCIILSRQVF